MKRDLAAELVEAANAPGMALAPAALAIARIEYPRLDAARYLTTLDAIGDAARQLVERRVQSSGDASVMSCVQALNELMFEELGFRGNSDRYEDPRNSCLNEVIDRRTGIPITLSVVYVEVARRAGLSAEGINFPGHFLVRVPHVGPKSGNGLIVDPFHQGAILTERDCRQLLKRQHAGNEVTFGRSLLATATRTQVIVRMLINLKRLYVHMGSFPQARQVIELLLAVNPSALGELRDRGLLAYQLNDVTAALHDLQTYLQLAGIGGDTERETREERERLWEHVKTLHRRVASLN
jgi:regulator of sirC expression with transglutaminase-like and TPR domain